MIWGKVICGFLGLLLGGPFGGLLGLVIGHTFDRSVKNFMFFPFGVSSANLDEARRTFFKSTFLVMGHIAKSDGRVSEREISAARGIMQRMALNTEQAKEAMRYFYQGKKPDFDLTEALSELKHACSGRRILLQMFVSIQFQAAHAEGSMSKPTQRVMRHICEQLGYAEFDYNRFRQSYQAESHYHTGYNQQYRQYQQRQAPRSMPQSSLSDAYNLLGVKKDVSDAELKKAYRRLMSQNHPDKLASKGLPEEMMKLATEKTQKN